MKAEEFNFTAPPFLYKYSVEKSNIKLIMSRKMKSMTK